MAPRTAAWAIMAPLALQGLTSAVRPEGAVFNAMAPVPLPRLPTRTVRTASPAAATVLYLAAAALKPASERIAILGPNLAIRKVAARAIRAPLAPREPTLAARPTEAVFNAMVPVPLPRPVIRPAMATLAALAAARSIAAAIALWLPRVIMALLAAPAAARSIAAAIAVGLARL